MAEVRTPQGGAVIVARAARDYRWKRFLLVAILFIYGLMSIRDGFFRYPHENDQARAQKLDVLPHPGLDVQLNQVLGVLLPPGSVAFLIWCLYGSRGEVRFDGATLSVPGHPPIEMNAIRRIDRAKWDRKGIAYVEYQFPGRAAGGKLKLDDFIYQREPVDQIFARLEAVVASPTGGFPVTPTPPKIAPAATKPKTPPAPGAPRAG